MSFGNALSSLRGHAVELFKVRRRHLSSHARRLATENLERRCVLSVAPLEVESEVPSLESYIAAEPEMGPVEPAVDDATDASSLPPDATDEYFAEQSGDDSGTGEDGGPLTGDADTSGEGEYIDQGIGTSSDATANAAPTITTFDIRIDLEDENYILLFGTISDDSLLEKCTINFGGIVVASSSVAIDGSFMLRIQRPDFSGMITASASDGELTSETVELYFDRQ